MEHALKALTIAIANGVELAAAVVIGVGALAAVVGTVRGLARRAESSDALKERQRLALGRWLALALEFELAADILRTAVAPTWNEIGQLAAIVVLRTALNYFLQREIDQAVARHPGIHDEPAAHPRELRH